MTCRADGVKFRVVVADPPWPYPLTGRLGSADASKNNPMHTKDCWYKYSVISWDDLNSAQLPLLDDSCLFLWCTSGNLERAMETMRSWGFKYQANFVWTKSSNGVTGLCGEWTGYWSRVKHELLLFGTRGKFRRDTKSAPFDSVFLLPRVKGGTGAKPDVVYDLIANAYSGPYLELFATKRRDGWFAYGDQVPGGSDISIESWDSLQRPVELVESSSSSETLTEFVPELDDEGCR